MRAKSLPLLVLLALAACEKNEPKPESTRKEAKETDAASKVEAIDPNLAEAVAAASVDKSTSAPPRVEGGPPPDGVFAPGEADKQIARGALPKVTLGSEGAGPKILLGPGKGAIKLSGTVQIAMQQDPRQGAIPILLDVTFESKKAEAPKDDKPVSLPVTVKVLGAKIDAPNAPKELDTSLAKLKGSKVEYSIVPGGAGAGFRLDIPKGAPDEFKDVVRGLSESISMLTIPYPDKALGAGGFFMVTSRDDFLGLDLVTYRMIKVKEVTPEGATLDVSTKRYAATRSFDLPGLPPNIDKTLAEFQSASDGSVKYPLGGLLPTEGEISSVLAAQLGGKDMKQRAVLQFQTRTQLNLK